MYKKTISYFGRRVEVTCDGLCNKAWGTNSRPRDEDGNMLSDDMLSNAPPNPGTVECGVCKPLLTEPKLNKWCVRECERSNLPSYKEAKERDYAKKYDG